MSTPDSSHLYTNISPGTLTIFSFFLFPKATRNRDSTLSGLGVQEPLLHCCRFERTVPLNLTANELRMDRTATYSILRVNMTQG